MHHVRPDPPPTNGLGLAALWAAHPDPGHGASDALLRVRIRGALPATICTPSAPRGRGWGWVRGPGGGGGGWGGPERGVGSWGSDGSLWVRLRVRVAGVGARDAVRRGAAASSACARGIYVNVNVNVNLSI